MQRVQARGMIPRLVSKSQCADPLPSATSRKSPVHTSAAPFVLARSCTRIDPATRASRLPWRIFFSFAQVSSISFTFIQ
jgi:hypothetical protein